MDIGMSAFPFLNNYPQSSWQHCWSKGFASTVVQHVGLFLESFWLLSISISRKAESSQKVLSSIGKFKSEIDLGSMSSSALYTKASHPRKTVSLYHRRLRREILLIFSQAKQLKTMLLWHWMKLQQRSLLNSVEISLQWIFFMDSFYI